MFLPRVVPCLLLHSNGLVKTRRFGSPTYVGDPINAIKIFNDKRVDELVFFDIDASRNAAEPNYRLIEQIASECFMPVCYGGGVRTVKQARRITNIGIEKVSVNYATLTEPGLIRELANLLGSQSVVASVDIKRNWLGKYRVYDSVRGKVTRHEPLAHIDNLIAQGAGEIFINNVDADGMQQGYDIGLISEITRRVNVPLIACGGAGSLEHIRAVTKEAGASAAAAGSFFVFKGPHRAVLINYPSYKELVELLA
ncbi:AglZ/HisF2 family acetamidino modification protein [Nitrococcus mobilis]|uniref:imidazole glycerol-phosphate synthase n=1 Tax=Nitrococcus mobilis Nb-231 TaxID=314278 RepID=A4BMH0_9GAMM|nr:AglZ/HisF2 family acetamidino modification protein [Nitrococcus mobilis]EAR23508.1 imidazole glycerol phosphate synthase subunit HisF [Nitrococcus mobilis Nb-231]